MVMGRDSITVQKESLYRLAYYIPLTFAFLVFTKSMLFGPCSLWISGVTVSEDIHITFQDVQGNVYLTGQSDFSKSGQKHGRVDYCRLQQNSQQGCLEEVNNQQIKVSLLESRDDDVVCHKVERKGLRCVNQVVKDCFNLEDHWYGGFEAQTQFWPLKKAAPKTEDVIVTGNVEEPNGEVELPFGPYISADPGIHKTSLSNVMDRIFFSSSGVGITVSKESPLYLSFNQHGDGKLCMAGVYDAVHYFSLLGKPPKLEYTVCKARNVKSIQDYLKKQYIDKPENIPNESLFSRPIWSTWAQYHKDINQSAVLEFASKIVSLKLPFSQLEIDDEWTPVYGDLVFDLVKFPDTKKMFAELTKSNIPVTVWVHPYLSLKSEAFKEAAHNKFTVMAKGSELPALVRWWNEDMAALLDVTNPAAVLWFQKKLHNLIHTYNVSSFKFDSGEGMYVPASHSMYGQMTTTNEYGTRWAELAYATDTEGRRQEVRVGWGTQRLPMIVRVMDRMSTWGHDGGLQSIIPTVLTLSVIGYPFVLPDMIGGNAYKGPDNFEKGDYPEEELYIRWIQATLFMPCLQFSIPPWVYSEEVVILTRKLLQLRESLSTKYINLAKESVKTGDPIIRPLWWIAPDDENALAVDDEFLVGNNLLVAPVVVKGARKRNIYLPEGMWQDKLKDRPVQGPTLLEDYPAALNQLPYFEKQEEE